MNRTIELPPASHTQAHAVAKHLRDLGTISGYEAVNLYRVTSLTKVVSVLQKKYGFSIRKEWKTDHTSKRYARYHLEG